MDNLSIYVMPVYRREGDERSFAGTAFCVEGYLVTAGHVLDADKRCYARTAGGRYYPLDYDRWLPRQLPAADRTGYDLAFYPVEGLHSPLVIADVNAGRNDSLDIVCYQWNGERAYRVDTSCIAGDVNDEGYQTIITADRITHGSSGCPVMSGNVVHGILTNGRDHVETTGMAPLRQRMEHNTCLMFTAEYIRRFMPLL